MEWFFYILISIIIFLLYIATDGKLSEAIFVALFWPLGLLYLILSLFYGAGRYL